MLAKLLPFLKISAPVAAVSVMGGSVYYVAANMPKNPGLQPLPGVYLLVKGTAAADVTEGTKTLTTTAQAKTTKNYKCQLTLADTKTAKDDACALYKLNSSTTTPADLIDLNPKMFDDALLASDKGSVTTSSHHILRVSKDFYKQLSLETTTDKSIKLLDAADESKHFGIVKEMTNLNLRIVSHLTEPSVKLFLARVKTPSSASSTWSAPSSNAPNPSFTCELSSSLSVGCNVYKLASGQESDNSLTKTNLASITPISSHTDVAADKYVVVELTDKSVDSSVLKNQVISIKQTVTTPAANADTTATKTTTQVAEALFDQALFGKASATSGQSEIFPLTPKYTTYIVKKGASTNAFNDMKTSASKNYRCQYTQGTNINYDNSCVLKTFPTEGNIHKYDTILGKTSFTDVSDTLDKKDYFLLTVDSRKLFNLSTKSKINSDVSVVAHSTSENKSQPFTLLQEVTQTKATGKTKAVLVKYNSNVALTNIASTGKCSLSDSDTTGITCTLKAATVTGENVTAFATTISTDFTAISAPTYFGVEFTEPKNISDFNGSSLHFYSTKNGTTTKTTFDIVATMGGEIAGSKLSYFLETPRSTISTTAVQQ